MKKCIIVFILAFSLLCFVSACAGKTAEENPDTITDQPDIEQDAGKEESEVDAYNRSMIAEALGVEENFRGLRFILNSLTVIEAGQIQSAKTTQVDGEKVLDIVAEDGTEFRIYLTSSGSVDAVKNLTTGEWPIASCR